MPATRQMLRVRSRITRFAPLVAVLIAASIGTPLSAAAARHHPKSPPRGGSSWHENANSSSPQLSTIFSGTTLGISDPDDITVMEGQVFVTFQNGVGPQGQASPTGDLDSTIVELSPTGVVENSWSIAGKCDGLTADRSTGQLIATVNEDLNSSLYTIDPATSSIVHYTYSQSPLPHNGGTDSISIVDGTIYIAASAPGTTGTPVPPAVPTYPALYSVALDSSTLVATVTPVFYDGSSAAIANAGSTSGNSTTLALTDPDSTEVVPWNSPRFGGDLVLDSQGDEEQIYVHDIGQSTQRLSVLSLSQSVNDSAWATKGSGSLYITDATNNLVDVLRGRFDEGSVYVAVTPCSSNSAPSTCPAPPTWPANYLATLDLNTGALTPVDLNGEIVEPQGLAFQAGGEGLFSPGRDRGDQGFGGTDGGASDSSTHHRHGR